MADPSWPSPRAGRPSKIVGVGRNFAAHARELGNSVPEQPLLFLKPPSSLAEATGTLRLPRGLGRIDHEVELGVILGARLKEASADRALAAIGGWCLALDVTARDVQARAKARGEPWAVAKGYDGFCPVSKRLGADDVDPRDAHLTLLVNDERRQDGNTRDMTFPVADLLSYISRVMTLEPGDLVLTGTPEGVGPLASGDHVQGLLDDTPLIDLHVL